MNLNSLATAGTKMTGTCVSANFAVSKELPVVDSSPSWYVDPERQRARLAKLLAQYSAWELSGSDIPPVPVMSRDLSEEEILLLSVYLASQESRTGLRRTFEELWSAIEPPTDFSKRREPAGVDLTSLRLAQAHTHVPGIRWVAFNPSTFEGMSSKDALRASSFRGSGTRLAGVEVLMAALMFPEWVSSWGRLQNPAMSGLQLYWSGMKDWSVVPTLQVEGSVGTGRGLILRGRMYDSAAMQVASPTVREVS